MEGFRRALIGVIAAAMAPVACVLTTDLDGLATNATSDGGPDSAAPIDGSRLDSEPSTSADATDDSSASTGFCNSLTPKPAFCDDFDGKPLAEVWTEVHVPQNGVFALDDKVSKSGPRSLFFQLPEGSTGDPTAFVRKELPSTASASKVTLAFDMRIDTSPPDNNQSYGAQLNIVTPTGEVRAYLHIGTGVTAMQPWENGMFPGDINLPALTNQFTRVSIMLALAKDASTIRVTYNDAQVLPVTSLGKAWEPGVPSFELGATYVNTPVVARAFHYDNVVFDAQ